MINLITASAFFLLLHRVVSGSSLRSLIASRIGEGRFRGAFALASFAAVAWLGFAYAAAPPMWREHLWSVPSFVRYAQLALQPVGLLLVITGFMTPNPGTVGQEDQVDRPGVVRGALRVTRHPFLWGVALISIGHMATVPSPRGLLLFGTLLVVALAGTASIDAKRRTLLGPRWTPFATATSNLPLAAILSGRQSLQVSEFSGKAPALAAALSALSWLVHPASWSVVSAQ